MAIMSGGADLHIHTTASDGLLSPAEVVRMAKSAGLEALAITDHDTVAGVPDALAEGRRLGLLVVPGAELSTSVDGNDIHILAYCTNNEDERWQERLSSLRGARSTRNELIVRKLQSLQIPITMDDVIAAATKGEEGSAAAGAANEASTSGNPASSIGRPHIAEALVRGGITASIREAFDRYLASGAAAYVSIPRIHPSEALQWIKDAGGLSVIAHPGLYNNDSLVEELIKQGVDGVEVAHSDHGPEAEERYRGLARRCRVIQTGGSDFHGERQGASYHGAIGARRVPLSVAREIMERGFRSNTQF